MIHNPQTAELRQVVGMRWQLRLVFYAGEMARPPKLQGRIPTGACRLAVGQSGLGHVPMR